jgi:hypothetical protein
VRPAPPGHEWVWEPETERGVEMAPPGWKRGCRWGVRAVNPVGCGQPAVWRVSLGGQPGYERWIPYCAEHTYGRRIVSGVLLVAVLRAVA